MTEARLLLDRVDVTTPIGLRNSALIALVFSFVRVGAALTMRVEDVGVQQRRLCVRLREKGGKAHEMPRHHTLEADLHAYLDGTGIGTDTKGPLFRTIARGTGRLSTTPLPKANAYGMVHRWAPAAGIGTAIDRQPHVPRHGHHRLSEKRWHARERRGNGQSRVEAHHAAV